MLFSKILFKLISSIYSSQRGHSNNHFSFYANFKLITDFENDTIVYTKRYMYIQHPCIYPLQDDKISDWSKLKQIAHYILSALKMENKYHIRKKAMWENEKLLVTCNSSFLHNVFHMYMSLVRQNAVLCGNGLSYKALNFRIAYITNTTRFTTWTIVRHTFQLLITGGNQWERNLFNPFPNYKF